MTIMPITKQQLLFDIEQLLPPYLIELQKFVQYLKFKQSSTILDATAPFALPPEQDPILKVIGIADVAPCADKIDEVLYGEL